VKIQPIRIAKPKYVESLDFTGERMVPEKASQTTFWEHIYRYRFATKFVRGKRVLDIACGEGYGSAALLQAGAASVIGVDISEETCNHARQKYGIDARPGDALNIPLPDQSVDLIVSFETIEHVDRPAAFLDECVRVLAPQGRLVISTPNRDVYSEGGKHNPFHQQELNQAEFTLLLNQRFRNWKLYTQSPKAVGRLSIRSLAASNTTWIHTRGFWRVRSLLRAHTCPHLWKDAGEEYRIAPVQTILSRDNYLASLVNPYAIRKWSRVHQEQSLYLIGIAQRI
jgi:SAM-dependent methyltransferase